MGPCVSALAEVARHALAVGRDVRRSIQVLLGMEQVSRPSASEADSSQQGPGFSEGSQAMPGPLLNILLLASYNTFLWANPSSFLLVFSV